MSSLIRRADNVPHRLRPHLLLKESVQQPQAVGPDSAQLASSAQELHLAPAPTPASIATATPVPNAPKSHYPEDLFSTNESINQSYPLIPHPCSLSCLSLANPLSRPTSSPIQRAPTIPQPLRSLFRSDIALGLSHEFVADEEFPHRRAAQEWRVEVDVEVGSFDFLRSACEGSLVETHACWGFGLVGWSIVTNVGEKLTVREVRLE
jgi:hypothetical protein